MQDLDTFVRSIASAGFVNSLAQTLIKLCAPGVSDTWQGAEFWDFNLVDPDNRRPVDFDIAPPGPGLARGAVPERSCPARATSCVAQWPDERMKMYVIWQTLGFRRQHPGLFDGDYLALAAEGPHKGQLCGFARVDAKQWAVVVVPRLALAAWRESELAKTVDDTTVEDGIWPTAAWWHETLIELPADAPHRWRDVLSGEELEARVEGGRVVIDAAQLFRRFPIALLYFEGGT